MLDGSWRDATLKSLLMIELAVRRRPKWFDRNMFEQRLTAGDFIPAVTGVPAKCHWLGRGGGEIAPQIISETRRLSETDEAAFESCSLNLASNSCLTCKNQCHVSSQCQVKGKNHFFHILGPSVGSTSRKEFKLTQSVFMCLRKVLHEYEGHT